jgi:hypothetical protein
MQENINIPDSTITTNLSFRNLVLMNMQQLTNFPYIEKDFDALTDYELLCLVVKFLNDVIANQNEQNASITRMYQSFLALQDYVNNTKDELEDAFNNLDDYVRNYFDNLDVQEEINNKLDQMLEDGVLEQIIEQFIQSSAIWCFDSVTDMKSATNLVNGSYAKTLGYHNLNDGGAGLYKIRNITGSDNVDEGHLIAMNNENLVAELIYTDNINVKQFGAYGDNNHDDTIAIQNAIDYCLETIGVLKINNGQYKITNELEINKTIKIYGEFKQGSTDNNLIYGAEIKQYGTNKTIFKIKGNNYGSQFENIRLSGDGNTNSNGTTIGISQETDGYFSEFTIKNVHFSYYLKYGVVLDNASIGDIDTCDFGENTIGVLINKASKITISKCNLWNNINGIKLVNATDINIIDNWIESIKNDSIGLLLQAPSRVLFSSLLNNTFNMINTCIKFDGITNISEPMCFVMFNIKNNRFTGSSPFIIDMKNSDNVQNTNADNRWVVTLENCVFNNVTSNQAIDIDFDYLGLGGWKMINCKAYSGWYGGSVNMFTSGQSNTATQNSDEIGLYTNGALNFDTVVSFPIIKNNSIFKGTYKLMVKDENGNANVLLSGKNGTTTNRPSNPLVGEMYYDTTIGKPIWWNGSAWKDSTGTTV